jgi:hypothetical protein
MSSRTLSTQLAAKAPAPRLTPAEQRTLLRAKTKIERIRPQWGRGQGEGGAYDAADRVRE